METGNKLHDKIEKFQDKGIQTNICYAPCMRNVEVQTDIELPTEINLPMLVKERENQQGTQEKSSQNEQMKLDLLDKDAEIKSLREQLSSLSRTTTEDQSDKIKVESQPTEHIQNTFDKSEQQGALSSVTHQLEMKTRCPEEDKTNRWRICACEKDTCPTCVAEKAAILTTYDPSCPWHTSKEKDLNDDEHPSQFKDDKGNNLDIRVSYDKGENSSNIYALWLHRTVSDSTLDGRKVDSKACAIISMLFANKCIQDPPTFIGIQRPRGLLPLILASIREGNETYDLNFKQSVSNLGPNDALLVNSYLGYHLKGDVIEFNNLIDETLLHYMIQLEAGQILQFYQINNYKVMCIICIDDNKHMLLFDSQPHDRSGACVFYFLKETHVLMKAIDWIHYYIGNLYGNCKLAVFEH